MRTIDPTAKTFATINMLGALIASPTGFTAADAYGAEHGLSRTAAMLELARTFAHQALVNGEGSNLYEFPRGSAVGDSLELFIEVAGNSGRQAYEDTLQEGELASNAIALINSDPSLWVADTTDGVDTFPGSMAPQGPERLNDLIKAAAYLLAEISRVERLINVEDDYNAASMDRGTVVLAEELANTGKAS